MAGKRRLALGRTPGSAGILLIALLFALNYARASGSDTQPGPHRVVSLAPSDTELLYSIGGQDCLAAVSTYCDYPPAARKLEKSGTFVSANFERLARLKPEYVLLVSGQEALASNLENKHFKAIVLPNGKLSQIGGNLRTLGKLTGHGQKADQLAASFDKAISELSALIGKARTRPRVFYCVWPEPLLTAGEGSFLNDVITTAGGINMGNGMKVAYPRFSMEKLVLSQPDVVVMPYECQKQSFLARAPWKSLKAVREKRLYFLPPPADDNLSRPTLRIIDGLYWLAVRIHPELAVELKEWRKQSAGLCLSGSNTLNIKKISCRP